MSKISVIIPAAGLSRRMKGFKDRKPFISLRGKPIISYTLNAFKKISGVEEIILVVNKKDIYAAKRYFARGIVKVIEGGLQRKDSVYNGIKSLSENTGVVLIHDGARPLIKRSVILSAIKAAKAFGAAVAAVPVVPTIKRVDEKGFVASTLNRKFLYEIQTPQAFKRDIIIKAYGCEGQARLAPTDITDDAMLVENMGHKVKVIMGSYDNIKITTAEDLKIAEAILCG